MGVDGSCATSWAAKAKTLYYIIRTLARIYTMEIGLSKVTFKDALRPRPSVTSLAPLGAPVMAGFARRPIWVCARTPEVVAANVWRARAADRRARATAASSTTTPTTSRPRTFANDWDINYAGYPSEDRWKSQASYDLEATSARARQARPRDLGDHPPADHPPTKKKRATDDDPGRPDPVGETASQHPRPSITRDFKRARLNEPPSQEDGLPSGPRALASSSSDMPPPTDGHCIRIQASGTSSTATGGASSGSKRTRNLSAWDAERLHCAACTGWTTYAEGRLLPLPPWLPGPWRGARPGSLVCRKCYIDFGATYKP